ncbi:MAG: putative sulfate/molybdate transporter [Geminicoccaceae bacterium]
MFEPHSKSRTGSAAARPKAAWIGDLSGAFADLGTFLPLVIGLLILGRFDPTGMLIGFGLFALATGLIYRLPMPVQPMKVVAALAIAGGLSAQAMTASGILLGLALLFLGTSGLIGRMNRLVPHTVLIGIQLGLGLHLLLASIDLADGTLILGAAALGFLILLQMTPLRPASCLLLVSGGIAWSLVAGGATLPPMTLAWHLPEIVMPSWAAAHEASTAVLLPQLALTLTNAVLLTSVLAADYFPKAGARTNARRLAFSTGALNLALMPIGAMPMCHGASGLAAQFHQGARSGLAPIIFGSVCLTLGLLAGPTALDWLLLVPLPVVAALLAYAGLHLVQPARFANIKPYCLVVIGLTALTSVLIDVASGLIAGLIAELIRTAASNLRRPAA